VRKLVSIASSIGLLVVLLLNVSTAMARPLALHPTNPRYFMDNSGKAVYLTGSHTWNTLQDWPKGSASAALDYSAYLNFLVQNRHNFTKLRSWEGLDSYPLPYRRTGPGTALDGGPKFDLNQFDPAYDQRLVSRVAAAQDRGIYVMMVLFQWRPGDRRNIHFQIQNHPFHINNNINGIHADTNGNGIGEEIQRLSNNPALPYQDSYVRHVLDLLNGYDNVIYEITNEGDAASYDWQEHMVQLIHSYESSKPNQHAVMMSGPFLNDGLLMASSAEAISPGDNYQENMRVSTTKVVMPDVDHIGWWACPIPNWFGRHWVWKSFTRGLHPNPLESLPTNIQGHGSGGHPCHGDDNPIFRSARLNMGYTVAYSMRIDLANMTPRPDLTSTGYALVKPGAEYLVYSGSSSFKVNLAGSGSTYAVEWLNPANGVYSSGGTVVGGGTVTFDAPFGGEAILYLKTEGPSPTP
jgi:hypothetical protein